MLLFVCFCFVGVVAAVVVVLFFIIIFFCGAGEVFFYTKDDPSPCLGTSK